MFKRKKQFVNKKNLLGGYKQYRKPLVFRAQKTQPKKEPRPLPKIPIKAVAILFLLILLGYYLFFSEKFRIRDVIIEGNKMVLSEKISASIPEGANIIRFSVKKAKKEILTDNPEIKNVEIYRGLPNAVKVVVLEHEGKMIWQTQNGRYLISSQGKVAKKIEEGEIYDFPVVIDKKNIPVKVGADLLAPNFVAFVNNISSQFFSITNIKPVSFEVDETTFDVNLTTEAGFYVKFNSLRSSSKQLDNLKKVLVEKRDQVHEYVDLRIDGWAYFK